MEPLLRLNHVYQVVCEVVVKVVIRMLVIHIHGQVEVGEVVVQILHGQHGLHVADERKQEHVLEQVEVKVEQFNV